MRLLYSTLDICLFLLDDQGKSIQMEAVSGYADGLRQLMRDEEARLRMGRAAQKYCADNFSREKIMEKWEQLLLSAVARG